MPPEALGQIAALAVDPGVQALTQGVAVCLGYAQGISICGGQRVLQRPTQVVIAGRWCWTLTQIGLVTLGCFQEPAEATGLATADTAEQGAIGATCAKFQA
ncbi:hypothetical protein D3C80_1422350 [compost metagenome]